MYSKQYAKHQYEVSKAKFKMLLVFLPIIIIMMILVWIADRKNPSHNSSSESRTSMDPSRIMSIYETTHAGYVDANR